MDAFWIELPDTSCRISVFVAIFVAISSVIFITIFIIIFLAIHLQQWKNLTDHHFEFALQRYSLTPFGVFGE